MMSKAGYAWMRGATGKPNPDRNTMMQRWGEFASYRKIRIDDLPSAWDLIEEYTESKDALAAIKADIEQAGGLYITLRGIGVRDVGGKKLDSLDAVVSIGPVEWDYHFSHNDAQLLRGCYDEPMWRSGKSSLELRRELNIRRCLFLRSALYSVLCSVGRDYSCSDYGFEEFCRELGFDPDSETAEATYRAVEEISRKFEKVFSPEALMGMPR